MREEAKELVEVLKAKGLKMSTAESCTGGMIAAAITDVSGSSEVFERGYVTYCNEAKHDMLGVRNKTLREHGAVSKESVREMAAGAAKAAGADVAVSVSGIAGPGGGSEEKPVGLVYMGVYVKGKLKSKKYNFEGDREAVRNSATTAALKLVIKQIRKCDEQDG
ncbi:MAG: CinA family protein [Lachnospiraceae bacterium]|nr:CinA family protein [Lachnospiraceae bacterium]